MYILYKYRKQHIFSSSQLNYSIMCGHRQLAHKKENRLPCLSLKSKE